MPTIETSTWLALKGGVQSLVLSPVLPIAWPNETYSPSPTQNYLRVTHIPNINARLFLGSTSPHRRLGLLQIDVFTKKGQPAAVATEIAGTVAAHFPTDLRLSYDTVNLRITKAPDVAQALPDDTHWLVPVTIRYELFA